MAIYKWLILCFIDIGIWGQLQSDRTKDTEGLVELQQVLSSLNETKATISGMALWRQQICAVAKVRFLKLKTEKKTLMTMWVPECLIYAWSVHSK